MIIFFSCKNSSDESLESLIFLKQFWFYKKLFATFCCLRVFSRALTCFQAGNYIPGLISIEIPLKNSNQKTYLVAFRSDVVICIKSKNKPQR